LTESESEELLDDEIDDSESFLSSKTFSVHTILGTLTSGPLSLCLSDIFLILLSMSELSLLK